VWGNHVFSSPVRGTSAFTPPPLKKQTYFGPSLWGGQTYFLSPLVGETLKNRTLRSLHQFVPPRNIDVEKPMHTLNHYRAWVCVYVFVCVYMCVRACVCECVRTYERIWACVCACVCARIRTFVNVCLHAYVCLCVCVSVCVCQHTLHAMLAWY